MTNQMGRIEGDFGGVADREHVRQSRDGQVRPDLDTPGVRPAKPARLAPFFGKGLRVFAAALEAGPVPGGKRCWLV